MVTKTRQSTLPRVKIDNPKNKDGLDLSDHYPIIMNGTDFNVVSYNVQFMPTLISNVDDKIALIDIKRSVNEITNYFVAKDADVCCVQELFDNTANSLMEAAMRKKGYVGMERVGNRSLLSLSFFNGGVRTFVKKTIANNLDEYEYIYKNKIDYFIGGDAIVNKGVIHTCFTQDGKKHHIFNTHLQSYYPQRDHYAEVTLAQCVELKKFIELQKTRGIIGPDDKIIICGDFNIPKPHSDDEANFLYEKMTRLMGSQFMILDYEQSPLGPKYTLSLKNSYNKNLTKSSDNDVNVDMAIMYDQDKVNFPPFDAELSDIYCDIQLAISDFVRNNATIFSQWLLSVDTSATLHQFNQQFTALMKRADEIKQQNINPMDDQAWFLQAVKLLRGPEQANITSAATVTTNTPTIVEYQETASTIDPSENNRTSSTSEASLFLEEEDILLDNLTLCKAHFDKLLRDLRELHDQIRKNYVASPMEYEKIFKISLKLNHILRNSGEEFFNNPTPKSFEKFQSTCNAELNMAKDAFENYASIWSKIHPIFKNILALLAAITVLPALLIATSSPHGFVKTFFSTPASQVLTDIKEEYEDKEFSSNINCGAQCGI